MKKLLMMAMVGLIGACAHGMSYTYTKQEREYAKQWVEIKLAQGAIGAQFDQRIVRPLGTFPYFPLAALVEYPPYINMVEKMLTAGANAHVGHGEVLRVAIKQGSGQSVALLLNHGADKKNSWMSSVLLYWYDSCCVDRDIKLALLLPGEAINELIVDDDTEWTVLYSIVRKYNRNEAKKIIKELLRRGADPRIKGSSRLNCIDFARTRNHETLASYLEVAVPLRAQAIESLLAIAFENEKLLLPVEISQMIMNYVAIAEERMPVRI